MAESERTLTTLEYIVLGLIGETPQSGYSIITLLESGSHRWSGSPGAIYPILKRLEKQGCIMGETVYETRPRRVYRLSPTGEALLIDWLRSPLQWSEVFEARDLAMIKFLFAEKRLSRDEVLAWLDAYEKMTESSDGHTFYDDLLQGSSLHQQLIHEMTIMELNTQRTWIQMARRRLAQA